MPVIGQGLITLLDLNENYQTGVDVEYIQTSDLTPPSNNDSNWSTNAPSWESGKYIWTRTKTIFSNTTPVYSNPVCITGATGKGIISIVEQYIMTTDKTPVPAENDVNWSSTQPIWEYGKYIWSRSKITYTDNTVSYTTSYCDSAWEAANLVQDNLNNTFIKSVNNDFGLLHLDGATEALLYNLKIIARDANIGNSLEIISCGKNLLKPPTTYDAITGLTITPRNDGGVDISGAQTNDLILLGTASLKSGLIYTLNFGDSNHTSDVLFVVDDANDMTDSDAASRNDTLSFMVNDNVTLEIYASWTSGVRRSTTFYPQIEIGTEATTFEKYNENIYEITLPTTMALGSEIKRVENVWKLDNVAFSSTNSNVLNNIISQPNGNIIINNYNGVAPSVYIEYFTNPVVAELYKNGIKAVADVDVEYALGSSSTTAPVSGWQTTAPTWESGKYMWQKTTVTYIDGTVITSTATCITGATGKGITSIVEQYYKSTSSSTCTGGSWSNNAPTWENGKYIWTKSIITYNDGTTTTTAPICATGASGTSAYFFVRYSANSNGSSMTTTPQSNTEYMGVATTTINSAPSSYTSYTWTKIKGTDGQNGSPGTPGADGRTQYLHIKYSDNGSSFTGNNGEDLGKYIGTYVDFTQADSTTFSNYTWKKFVGEDGDSITIVRAYKRSTTSTAPTIAHNGNALPSGWTATPQGVDSSCPYEFVSECTVTNGTYGTWSGPVVYAHYGDDGSDATVTLESVFNAATNNGAIPCVQMVDANNDGENESLIINANYIQTGTLSADRMQANVISAINGSNLTINADRLDLSGCVTASSLTSSGSTVIDGSRITTGEIKSYGYIDTGIITLPRTTINITNSNIETYFTIDTYSIADSTIEYYTFTWNSSTSKWISDNKGVSHSLARIVLRAKQDMDISFNYSYSCHQTYGDLYLWVAGQTIEYGVGGATTVKSYTGSLQSGQEIKFGYLKSSYTPTYAYDDQCTFFNMTTNDNPTTTSYPYSGAGTKFDLSNGTIKSTNFVIQDNGDVYLRGTINATSGNIGKFDLSDGNLAYSETPNQDLGNGLTLVSNNLNINCDTTASIVCQAVYEQTSSGETSLYSKMCNIQPDCIAFSDTRGGTGCIEADPIGLNIQSDGQIYLDSKSRGIAIMTDMSNGVLALLSYETKIMGTNIELSVGQEGYIELEIGAKTGHLYLSNGYVRYTEV